MESIEIIIFLIISIVIGVLVLNFMTNYDYSSIKTKLDNSNNDSLSFKIVDEDGFYLEILNFWDKSAMCEDLSATTTIYLKTSSLITINKEKIFDFFKSVGSCNVINSKKFECGTFEDLYFYNGIPNDPLDDTKLDKDINLPAVLRFSCFKYNDGDSSKPDEKKMFISY